MCKHSVYTHFPEERNCEICKRTKITRAPCRRRNGGAVPGADNFGDLVTADHKVLRDSCESRNNHRYVVVVQDLATQWIQAYPCKTKTSQETQRSLQKLLEPERKPKVIYTDNSLEFGKACEDLSWNHCTSTPHRSETNGIAERAVRRVKEGTSAVLLQSGLKENRWADSMECYTYLRNVTDLLSDAKTPYERLLGQPKFYIRALQSAVGRERKPHETNILGYEPGRSTAGVTATLRQVLSNAAEWCVGAFVASADVEGAFDGINHDDVEKICFRKVSSVCYLLRESSDLKGRFNLLGAPMSLAFLYARGARQGSVEGPDMWSQVLDNALRESAGTLGNGGSRFHACQ